MTDKELDALLHSALYLPIDPRDTIVQSRKGAIMNRKKIVRRVLLVAAVLVLLVSTAYASGMLPVAELVSGGMYKEFDAYSDMRKAMKQAGFQMTAPEQLPDGYTFQYAYVRNTDAYDDAGKKLFTYNILGVNYTNPDGRLSLSTHQAREELVDSSDPAQQVWQLDGITVEYRLHHYKFVPENYKLTPEDEANQDRPGYYISYGADIVEERQVAFVNWDKDGVSYTIMDSPAHETVDTLMAIAEAMIRA